MKNTKPELRFAGFTDDWEQVAALRSAHRVFLRPQSASVFPAEKAVKLAMPGATI